MKTAREIAADILCEVDGGALSHEAFSGAVDRAALLTSDRAFVKKLVSGVLEHRDGIDAVIDRYSKKPVSALKPLVRNTLRIGVYQLMYLTDIPQSAVCNEAVAIIARRRMTGLKGYVNAILRSCCRDGVSAAKSACDVPDYIRDILMRRTGENGLQRVLKSFDGDAELTCRFLTSRAAPDEIKELLGTQGITAERSPLAEYGYILSGVPIPGEVEAFKRGLIQYQGISSVFAVQLLDPAPGSIVLDICAAPGGKSIALADMVGENGIVVARDLTERKVRRIEENAARCFMPQIRAEVRDAREFLPEDEEKFDCVLADLPCSGLGTIGHKQEIRYRIIPDKVRDLAALQKDILKNAVRYLKKGGRMLYSTCTITFEENEDNFRYIRDELGLAPVSIEHFFPAWREGASDGYVQLLPGTDPVSDGFFCALFEKRD